MSDKNLKKTKTDSEEFEENSEENSEQDCMSEWELFKEMEEESLINKNDPKIKKNSKGMRSLILGEIGTHVTKNP
ncbi:MAG: hypothetical protein NDI62_00010 [Burkholderiales bacterium]|nr:hypothetical protein [Burkholderiales bacterium]